MLLKRPHILLVERRERSEFSLDSLLAGGAGVVSEDQWIALAPHLGIEVQVSLPQLELIGTLGAGSSRSRTELEEVFGEQCVAHLVDAGLLIGDHAAHASLRQRDQAFHRAAWWAPSAVAQAFGRWQSVDVESEGTRQAHPTLAKMLELHGPPPVESLSVRPPASWLALPVPGKTALDTLLESRTTCRNFDQGSSLPLADLSAVMHRVFGIQAMLELGPEARAVKKNSPSGGGLHPIEAYLLVQRVEGLAPGLYHYQCAANALEPMRLIEASATAALARELVAGQSWFAGAPVLVVMVARFQRTFWKYRNHAKAWKVIQLDAGHLSQNLYLSATELGYGAFITAAMNDECAERCFELDGVDTGAIAVCGFGRRSAELAQVELDPLQRAVR